MVMDIEVCLKRGPAKLEALFLDKVAKPAALARLGEFTSLNELILEKERALPASIGQLTRLRSLSLGQPLREVPDELAALGPGLESLSLAGGVHPDVAERVLSLLAPAKKLVQLAITGVVELPPSLAKLRGKPLVLVLAPVPGADLGAMGELLAGVKLDALEVIQRKAQKKDADLALAALVAPLRKLRRLVVRFDLQALPDEVGEMAALEELELERCAVRALPDGLRRLRRLRVLKADASKIAALPEWLGELAALRELHLAGNGLRALPDSIGELSNLEVLSLAANRLKSLPASAAKLTGLRVLGLNRNQLVALPPELHDVPDLSIDENPCADAVAALRVAPEELVRCTGDEVALAADAFLRQQPKELQLVMPALRALPPSIAKLVRLEVLHLECEALDLAQAWPLIVQVPTLRELVVVNGTNGSPPASISNLVKLETLKLIDAGVTKLPDSIGELGKLVNLNLAINPIDSLPESLGRCAALESLWLEDAQVKRLPDAVCGLPKLARLGLRECPLEALPEGLDRLPLGGPDGSGVTLWKTRFKAPPDVLSRLTCPLSIGQNTPPWDPEELFDVLARNPHVRTLELVDGFARLPAALGRLGIRRLDLQRLEGVQVPPELAGCANLERIDLPEGVDAAEAKMHLPPGKWKKGTSGSRTWFSRV